MALVIVLSAFNGIDALVHSLYSSFDAEIRIEPAEGKVMAENQVDWDAISRVAGVDLVNRSLEETVLFRYSDNQSFATLKGVDEAFLEMSRMDTMIWSGGKRISGDLGEPYALLGYLVADNLGVIIQNVFEPLQVYSADREARRLNMTGFDQKAIMPGGVFSINAEHDAKYVVVPRSFASELLKREGEFSAIEISLKEGANDETVRDELQALLGEAYVVKTRYEQNELMYKTNKTEKWFTFLILAFILVIATFNVIGSLTMLILDKKNDVFTLRSMGASKRDIRQIFFFEGLLISMTGGLLGIALGLLVCGVQEVFGVVRMESLLVDTYPILIEWGDIALVGLTVVVLGAAASYLPVRFLSKRLF